MEYKLLSQLKQHELPLVFHRPVSVFHIPNEISIHLFFVDMYAYNYNLPFVMAISYTFSLFQNEMGTNHTFF